MTKPNDRNFAAQLRKQREQHREERRNRPDPYAVKVVAEEKAKLAADLAHQRDSAQLAFSKLAQAHDEVLQQRDDLQRQLKGLIASNHELLAALKHLHSCHRAFSSNDNWTSIDDEARAEAEAAIAAAEGTNQ